MKLATIEIDGSQRVCSVVQEGRAAVDLLEVARRAGISHDGALESMLALIDGGPQALDVARQAEAAAGRDELLPLESLRLLAPIPVPRQIRDCLVFEEHLKNALEQAAKMGGRLAIPDVWYEQPIYYKANRFSVIGPDADIEWPAYSRIMDYELELACVIGKTGKDIAREDADEHIFGLTIFNDCSARDTQMKEMAAQLGPAKGKDFDTGNIFGPWIVTRDEIGNGDGLDMTARINGEVWGGGNSSAMHHKFADIIAHVSASETLHAGEIVCSGTVGTGCGLELGRYPREGDVVELEIEGIGVLRNKFTR